MADEYGSDLHGRKVRDVEVAARSPQRIPLIVASVSFVVVIIAGVSLVSILAGGHSDAQPEQETAASVATTAPIVVTTTVVDTATTTISEAEPDPEPAAVETTTPPTTQTAEPSPVVETEPAPADPPAEVLPAPRADGAVPGEVPALGTLLSELPDHWIVGPDGHTYGHLDPTRGTSLEVQMPDFFTIGTPDGRLRGYGRRDEALAERGPEGFPVYAADGVTVIGHSKNDVGFVPLG